MKNLIRKPYTVSWLGLAARSTGLVVLTFAAGCARAPGPATPIEEPAMMVIRVVVDVVPDQRDAFVDFLAEEAVAVRKLDGCERYELYEHAGSPNRFMLYEEWASPSSFEAYRNSESMKRSFAVLGPMMAGAPDSAYFHATPAD